MDTHIRALTTTFLVVASLILSCSKNKGDVTGDIEEPIEQDHIPPSVVSDLRASFTGEYEIRLAWTAPSDSGSSCAEYDLRQSPNVITGANFEVAMRISHTQHPMGAGGSEEVSLTGLETDTRYFFALKTRDENDNWSALSNVLEVRSLLDSVVAFPDTALERLVRLRANRPEGILRRSHLDGLLELLLSDAGIRQLDGLRNCRNLQRLVLTGNQVSDLSPIAGMSSLTGLTANRNLIAHLPDLSGLTSLTTLVLSDNPLDTITEIGKLTTLRLLSLDNLHLANMDVLAGLTDLEELFISGNSLADIEPLRNLRQLRSLLAINNRISDLTPLVENPGIGAGDELWIMSNPLSQAATDVQIPVLEARGVTVHR